ncbi:MAG: glycine/betaine ABC transporter substrate-binding protein [Acidobacteria bacterium RIFCSPLOWO2_02_FULL_67_21]|nr:MAG: glycine/betaine ABC transporter substrate-binding protein [Acidobacteria bacterium RIFCSPLOWO2_02_FULL_67_21]
MRLLEFWISHRSEVAALLLQHAALVLISTSAAILVGVPAGVLAARRLRPGRWMLAVVNVAQTIPSLALLGFLLPLPFIGGLGSRTALITLSIYALLPILRTTMTGLQQIDRSIIEAGVAMGMTGRQLLWLVELPLALPSIIGGIRVATVVGVATATIAAAIGAGGLGEYIFRGLSMADSTTILAGAIPAAALALVADALLGWAGRRLSGAGVTSATAIKSAGVAVFVLAVAAGTAYVRAGSDAVVVGSKNFTEQVILGELVAQSLEAQGLRVDRRLNLGGTFICDRALRGGELDVYVEYTGTALTAIFNQDVSHDPRTALDRTRELYARHGVTVAGPLGFNNTFAILVRGDDARRLGLQTIDDLRAVAGLWTPGFGYEFLQRQDGYPGLAKAYGLQFAAPPRAMDLSLIYRALADGQVDVIAGDATSALIPALDLAPLADTRQYFPPYDAVPVVRTASVLRQPAIGRALAALANRVSEADIRSLNAAVDIDRRDVRDVVREFLEG